VLYNGNHEPRTTTHTLRLLRLLLLLRLLPLRLNAIACD